MTLALTTLAGLDFNKIPWYIGVILVIGTVIVTRLTSKDKVDSNLITQTVRRQEQLDKRQSKMMDDMQEELGRFREELIGVRKELTTERGTSLELSKKISYLEQENRELKRENDELKKLIRDLNVQLRETEESRLIREKQRIVAAAAQIKIELANKSGGTPTLEDNAIYRLVQQIEDILDETE